MPGDEMFSQFAVANNPADQVSPWALIITGIGLSIHFLIMLVNFTVRSRNEKSHHGTPMKKLLTTFFALGIFGFSTVNLNAQTPRVSPAKLRSVKRPFTP